VVYDSHAIPPICRKDRKVTLTKAGIAETIQNTNGFSSGRSVRPVESIIEIMKKSLEPVEDVLISRFGEFSVRAKKKGRGRNPATGESLVLGAREIVAFRWSAVLRQMLNGEGR